MTTAQTILTIIGTLATGGILGVILTHKRESSATLLAALSARLSEVEKELATQREVQRAQDARYTALWAYSRRLIDYAYRHRKADAPPLPDIPDELN